MMNSLYVLGVAAMGVGLVVFSYLDRIYRELGRVTTGRVHANLEIFEAEVEPHFGLHRQHAASAFRLLAALWLVLVTAETARGVIVFVPNTWDALAQALIYVLVEVLLLSQLLHLVLQAPRLLQRRLQLLLLGGRLLLEAAEGHDLLRGPPAVARPEYAQEPEADRDAQDP